MQTLMSNTQVQAIDLAKARVAANGIVNAAVSEQGASARFLATVTDITTKLTAGRNGGLTSAQWDKEVSPSLKAAFDRAVKAGRLAESTVPGYRSRIKMAVLTMVNNVAVPNKGEAIKAFLDRTCDALAKAQTPSGENVLPVTKVGAKGASNRSQRKAGGKAKGAGSQEPATNVAPFMAAALILSGNHKGRAEKLVAIFSKKPLIEQFDKFAQTVLA